MQSLRRQVKNVAYNYSDAQKKAREATSNKQHGPTTTQMMEIADYMQHPVAFNEVMSILWKRINDSGRNWRHVYKSLILLDFLIKCGNKRVAILCRDNIYAIDTLKDFQHVEDGRDQGYYIREKATALSALIKNDVDGKETNGTSADGASSSSATRAPEAPVASSLPRSADEEARQLRLAMELSMQEQQQEKEENREYEIRLQKAIEDSKREADEAKQRLEATTQLTFSPPKPASNIDDLLSLDFTPAPAFNPTYGNDLLNSGVNVWSPPSSTEYDDPWSAPPSQLPPWGTPFPNTASSLAQSSVAMSAVSPPMEHNYDNTADLLDITPIPSSQPPLPASSFLNVPNNGVDIDSLVALNLTPVNPFAAEQRRTPTLNEMRQQQQVETQNASFANTNPFATMF